MVFLESDLRLHSFKLNYVPLRLRINLTLVVKMNRCASFCSLHPSKEGWELTASELESLPKAFLLKYYSGFINYLWDRLPERLQCDSEIASYRKCNDHFNQPWEWAHVDAPGPTRRDCEKCATMEELVYEYAIKRTKNPGELTKSELQIISPTIFKKYFSDFTDILWDRMPSYYHCDSEIASYRRCYEHWNTSSMEDHIDGPIPQRRNCGKCHESTGCV